MRTATPAELATLSDAYDILVSLGFPDAAAGVDEALKRNAECPEPCQSAAEKVKPRDFTYTDFLLAQIAASDLRIANLKQELTEAQSSAERAAASMEPMELSDEDAAAIRQSLSDGTARPTIEGRQQLPNPCRQAVAPRKASTTLDILAVLAIAGVAGIMFTGGNLFASALDFGVILAALIGAWMLWSASGVRDRRPVIAALGGLLCLPAGIWIGLALASHGVVGGLTGIGCCVAWCAFLGVRSRRSENET